MLYLGNVFLLYVLIYNLTVSFNFHSTFLQLDVIRILIDFLKVVRLVFWSGVVGPGTSFRSLAFRATRSKARLVSKSRILTVQ